MAKKHGIKGQVLGLGPVKSDWHDLQYDGEDNVCH